MISGRGPAKTRTVRLSAREEDALDVIVEVMQRRSTYGRITRGEAIREAINWYHKFLIDREQDEIRRE